MNIELGYSSWISTGIGGEGGGNNGEVLASDKISHK